MSDAVARAAGLVGAASRIVILTGAGVSAESGIPTFRDALTGLWARHDPERLATAEGFAADPELVWGWYASRRAVVRSCQPNAAHLAIARLQRREGVALVTQNVDGLHARARSCDVVELHGNITRAKCFDHCGWHGDADALEAQDARVPPRCPGCGGMARPDVVWFGEMLPPTALEHAESSCRAADLCVVVGTSGLVYPAAGLPSLAKRSGARVIVIGPEPTAVDAIADAILRGRAGELMPFLVDSG